MRAIPLNENTFFINPVTKKIILLGDPAIEREPMYSNVVLPKVIGKQTHKVPGLWGTLGMMNDDPINWIGNLIISRNGNESSEGITREEIKLIYAANPQLDNKNLKVIERFISFEDVKFDFPEVFSDGDIPKFRLTLMLDTDEGALVYYQYHNQLDAIDDEKEDVISYIHPESTGDNNHVNIRDRLTYLFEAIPPKRIIDNPENKDKVYRLSASDNQVKFLIKILTYKRGEFESSKEVTQNQLTEIVKSLKKPIEKKPELLIFDYNNNEFIGNCKGKDVSGKLKTLLLIHGTFGTTEKSFKALIDSKWLKLLIDQKVVEQIIAFDHPTVLEDAKSNITSLLKLLNDTNFEKSVDIIGTSQGGLLVQYLANLPASQKKLVVGKVVLVASANGVDYVNTALKINKILSIFKVISRDSQPELAFICSLAQHSIDFFVKLPGIDLMKPGGQRLLDIVNEQPIDKTTIYLPIIDDFTKELVAEEKFFKMIAILGLDLVIKSIMGPYNDWVVRSENQFKVPMGYSAIPNYDPNDFQLYLYPAIHGKCLDRLDVREKMLNFFLLN